MLREKMGVVLDAKTELERTSVTLIMASNIIPSVVKQL